MPTYQYACTACDHRFDAVQSFSDPSLTDCPVCSERLRKVFSSVGIVFKGSGFYRTDSRSSATVADTKTETKSESKSESNGSAASSSSSSKESSSSTSSTSSSSSTSTPAAAAS